MLDFFLLSANLVHIEPFLHDYTCIILEDDSYHHLVELHIRYSDSIFTINPLNLLYSQINWDAFLYDLKTNMAMPFAIKNLTPSEIDSFIQKFNFIAIAIINYIEKLLESVMLIKITSECVPFIFFSDFEVML